LSPPFRHNALNPADAPEKGIAVADLTYKLRRLSVGSIKILAFFAPRIGSIKILAFFDAPHPNGFGIGRFTAHLQALR
jgi:hypothetical protein